MPALAVVVNFGLDIAGIELAALPVCLAAHALPLGGEKLRRARIRQGRAGPERAESQAKCQAEKERG